MLKQNTWSKIAVVYKHLKFTSNEEGCGKL